MYKGERHQGITSFSLILLPNKCIIISVFDLFAVIFIGGEMKFIVSIPLDSSEKSSVHTAHYENRQLLRECQK